MKTIMAIPLFLLSVSQTRIPIGDEVSKEDEITKSMSFSGAGPHELTVDIVDGGINVTGYDGHTVEVKIHQRIVAASAAKLRDAEKNVNVEFSAEESNVAVRLQAPYRTSDGRVVDQSWKRFGYYVVTDVDVRVPRKTNIVLRTTNKGDISVDSITGSYVVSHINGSISMSGIAGSGTAETINGGITISFSENPTSDIVLKTVSGQLQADFQDGMHGEMVVSTISGDVMSEFHGDLSRDEIQGLTDGGKKIYRIRAARSFKIGKDGPRCTFTTINGNISILRNPGR
jgi:hypothetical protein